MTQNLRYKDITKDDTTIRVGYNYIKQKYYVTNQGTTTYRPYDENLKAITDLLEVFDISLSAETVTEEELRTFRSESETLENIYYTWQDTGSYIHTLQFNDFNDYPLVIDCERAKLYIMNSPIVYDLTVNESLKEVRVPHLCNFYKTTVGLEISQDDMLKLCNLLLEYYKPTWYNQINPDKTPLEYSAIFALTNYNNSSLVNCHCSFNTLGDSFVKYYPLLEVNNSTEEITILNTDNEIGIGNTISINGTSVDYAGEEFSADGEYTVKDVSEDGLTITVAETFPIGYEFPYNTCKVVNGTYTVTNTSRENNTITVSETPSTIIAGDIVRLSNAVVATTYETISCDGEYTVQSINKKVITVKESIPTDFEGSATLTKELFVGNISTITDDAHSVITMTKDLSITPSASATIVIYTREDNTISRHPYTVESTTENTITITEQLSAYNIAEHTPKCYLATPTDPISINVTSIDESIEEVMPIGEFIVNNFAEAKKYISNTNKVTELPDEIQENYENKVVPMEMETTILKPKANPEEEDTYITMQCLGLYSKNYTDGI